MNQRKANCETPPGPDMLAAYVDGELDGSACARVEKWLADHADAREEVQALQRLHQLFADAAAPEPTEPAWAAALARIEARITETRPDQPGRGPGWRLLRWGLAVGTLAASLLFVAVALRGRPAPPPLDRIQPLPVASDHDVEILSMEDEDMRAVVVGTRPLLGRLVLASAEDISEVQTSADEDGQVPEHRGISADRNFPMIVAPLVKAP